MKRYGIILLTCLLTACGFHLQGEMPLAAPLHKLYLNTSDPYGSLARNLRDNLKASHVELVASSAQAQTVLVILHETPSQTFLSVNGNQQTRQYNLAITVAFEITDPAGKIIVPPQTLSESRVITVQSNQVLGSSNEANLFYLQMRRTLAYAILNRLASQEISKLINAAVPVVP